MNESMERYAARIESREISPTFGCAGRSGLIVDSSRDEVPLTMLSFGRLIMLPGETVAMETRDREYAFIPVNGDYLLKVDGESFAGSRHGGPFAVEPGKSNASAVYIPGDMEVVISGEGEVIYFSAPTTGGTRPVHVPRGSVPNLSRGHLTWRRDVVTLIESGEISTNLVIGETRSPPGLWSGTPLHVHDSDDPDGGESDHEEVYYHLMDLPRGDGFHMPHTIQLLFDGERVNQAYIMRDRDAFAIPGGSHPVVASPISASHYTWGLAGSEGGLLMRDIPEFSYLKAVGEFINDLEQERGLAPVSRGKVDEFCRARKLDSRARSVLESNLRERGFEVAAV